MCLYGDAASGQKFRGGVPRNIDRAHAVYNKKEKETFDRKNPGAPGRWGIARRRDACEKVGGRSRMASNKTSETACAQASDSSCECERAKGNAAEETVVVQAGGAAEVDYASAYSEVSSPSERVSWAMYGG